MANTALSVQTRFKTVKKKKTVDILLYKSYNNITKQYKEAFLCVTVLEKQKQE